MHIYQCIKEFVFGELALFYGDGFSTIKKGEIIGDYDNQNTMIIKGVDVPMSMPNYVKLYFSVFSIVPDPGSNTGPQGDIGPQGIQGFGLQGIQGVQGIQGNTGLTGNQGLQGNQGITGQAATGIIIFFQDLSSNISTYSKLLTSPTAGIENNDFISVSNSNGERLIEAYITDAGFPGITSLQNGYWEFDIWRYVSSTNGTTNLVFRVYKRTTGGTETEIFNISSSTINDLSITEEIIQYTTTSVVSFNIDDRIVIKVFAKTTNEGNVIVHFIHDGNTHTSHIHTPITQGIIGTQGYQGVQGSTNGPQGYQGIIGNQGPQGVQGIIGTQGSQGSRGLQGTTGNTGNQGNTGLQGTQGNIGLTGPQGNIGSQGIQGNIGLQGGNGTQGSRGLQGFQGNIGIGTQGNQGPSGGPQGTQGDFSGNANSLVFPSTTGFGIQVNQSAPQFGWVDLLGPLNIRGTGNFDPSWNSYMTNIRQYQFSVTDECWFEYHIPHDYVPGSNMYIHAHWSVNTHVTFGSVTWGFDITTAKGYNRAAFPNTVSISIQQTASTTAYQHMIAESQFSSSTPSENQINNNLFETDGLILVHVSLDANTMNNSAQPFLHFVDIHYQSTQIATRGRNYPFYF